MYKTMYITLLTLHVVYPFTSGNDKDNRVDVQEISTEKNDNTNNFYKYMHKNTDQPMWSAQLSDVLPEVIDPSNRLDDNAEDNADGDLNDYLIIQKELQVSLDRADDVDRVTVNDEAAGNRDAGGGSHDTRATESPPSTTATTDTAAPLGTPGTAWLGNDKYVAPEVIFLAPTSMPSHSKSTSANPLSADDRVEEDDDLLPEEHFVEGIFGPERKTEADALFFLEEENPFDEDIETQIQPNIRNRRYTFRRCERASGEIVLRAQLTLSSVPSRDNHFKQQVAEEIVKYIHESMSKDHQLKPQIVTTSFEISPNGTVDMDIQLFANSTNNCDELNNSNSTISTDVAKAFVRLDKEDNLQVANITFAISKPMVENNNNQLVAATCVLCASYHKCVINPTSNEWFCQFYNEYFYPFGPNQNDKTMTRDSELVSAKININHSLPFGNELFDNLWISINGLISFGNDNSSFTPKKLPADNFSKLLAVYWSDLDLLSSDKTAEIYYQLYTKSTSNKVIFDRANSDVVRNSGDVKSYDASTILTVTWVEVPAHQSVDERVSFQCVVITDGFTTYVSYRYCNGAMQFNPDKARPVVVGWGDTNFDTLTSSYYLFDRIRGNGKDNTTGFWFFKVGGSENFKMRCERWYQANYNETNLNRWLNALPGCPCREVITMSSGMWNKTKQSNCYDTVANYGEIGMRCCYRDGGNFENRPRLAGAFQRYNALGFNLAGHELNDVLPYSWCCEKSDLCDYYYKARPISTCNSNLFERALLFGDPHIITLDQRAFIFNGLGEYTILEIVKPEKTNFIMQGRTCPAKGRSVNNSATIWCALAFQTTLGDVFRVEIKENSTTLIMYVNKEDITRRYAENSKFNEKIGAMVLKKEADSLQIITTDDIIITVKMANEILEFSIDLPFKYKNSTVGLLGNFNGNSGDDFRFPNGTVLPNNTSERVLFDYGNSWRVNNSIFVYEYGKSTMTYYNPTFKPIFLDENLQFLNEASKFCNGTSNLPCVFDFIVTGNEKVAKNSATTVEVQTKIVIEKEIVPPTLSDVGRTNVIEGGNFSITISGSSSSGQGVNCKNVSGSFYTLHTVNQTSCLVQGTADSRQQEVIAISTVASTGIESKVVPVCLIICICQNEGICNYNNTRKYGDNCNLLAACNCTLGFTGLNCEIDKDGCASKPCQTNCTDVPARIESVTGLAYNCSSCLAGYSLSQNNTKCEDINECDSKPCGTNSICINTIGSYYCSCSSGFRFSSRNQNSCIDINECSENTHNCVQKCVNTAGSYNCECEFGYIPYQRYNCLANKTLNPCDLLKAKNITCEHNCRSIQEGAQDKSECFCRSGYRLKNDGMNCDDIDECYEKLCSQNCNNTGGNYTCSCQAGYQLSGRQVCVECPGITYGDNCLKTCNCKGRALRCDKVKGCICRSNWRGENCDVDVNECIENSTICRSDQKCVNSEGGYSCICENGYADVNGTCTNIDECKNVTLNSCEQICVDTKGSYVCRCEEGYTKNGSTACKDVDECKLGLSQCEQLCINNIGSYSCGCYDGYTLKDDRQKCFRDLDLCLSTNINCSYGCSLVNKTALCFCATGYILATNNLDCIDINECESDSPQCFNKESCKNLPGTYACFCPDGYKLQNDQRSCLPCDEYHWGPECSNTCDCFYKGSNSCDPITGCVCIEGWAGKYCDQDKNECSSDTTTRLCPEHSNCINTIGSYFCQCKTGYVLSEKACVDVDECVTTKPCEQQCLNTIGSYTCSCVAGFYAVGDYCHDINECGVTELNNCEQSCRNTLGGFACECFDGYLLNTTTRNTCFLDSTEKSCSNQSSCEHFCLFRQNNHDICQCKPGYKLNENNRTCDDIDECLNSPCVNGSCINRNGSFACSCYNGSKLLVNGLVCKSCYSWTYGANCSGVCTCDTDNSVGCDPLNGTCLCSYGWSGPNCTQDVNECSGTNSCSNFSTCRNMPGHYICDCNVGFYSTGDFSCNPCDTWQYGLNCNNQCECYAENTRNCNDVSGECTCKSGWQGSRCDQDINECIVNSSYCPGSHEMCYNLNGSADCRCISGYARKFNESLCTDVDECFIPGLNNCNNFSQDCRNSEGSYFCECKAGFKEANKSCIVNFRSFSLMLRLDYPDSLLSDDVFDSTKKDFFSLAIDIEKQLLQFTSGNESAFLPPKITRFFIGSLIADTLLRLDLNHSTNPSYDVAELVDTLQSAGQFMIGNLSVPILDITVDGITVTHSYCDLYHALKNMYPHTENKAKTQCDASDESGNNDMIIGLAVGIPLGVGLIVLVTIIIVVCIRRRPAGLKEDNTHESSSVTSGFSNNLVARMTDSSPYYYSPVFNAESRDEQLRDELADTYQNLPENKPEVQEIDSSTDHDGYSDYVNYASPSFAWDKLESHLDNVRDFQIQRPTVQNS